MLQSEGPLLFTERRAMIEANDRYWFEENPKTQKYHITLVHAIGGGLALPPCAHARYVSTDDTNFMEKVIDAEYLCGNCKRHADAYEEVPEHIAAMSKDYRIMRVGEEITSECKFWRNNKGPWQPFLGADEAYARVSKTGRSER
jgi:hypothetical protein